MPAYKKALALKPDAAAPQEKLAVLALSQQHFDDAMQYAKELSQQRDSKVLGEYYKGMIRLQARVR